MSELSELEYYARQSHWATVDISNNVMELARSTDSGLKDVGNLLQEQTQDLMSCFEDLSWKMQLQSQSLQSIDGALRNPGQIKANELRRMAEELVDRRELAEAEPRFINSLEANPLDFRTYVGLAHIYISEQRFDDAKHYLGKSLSHASEIPQQTEEGIDNYKSVSFRLLAIVEARQGNYDAALILVDDALAWSPRYATVLYERAKYLAAVGNLGECVSTLLKAIKEKPYFWDFARKEKYFSKFRVEIDDFLNDVLADVSRETNELISKLNDEVTKVHQEAILARQTAVQAGREGFNGVPQCRETQAIIVRLQGVPAYSNLVECLEARDWVMQAITHLGGIRENIKKDRNMSEGVLREQNRQIGEMNRRRKSTLATVAFALTMGTFVVGVTFLPGMILGFVELHRIKKGVSPEGGKGFATAAAIVGLIFTVMFTIYIYVMLKLNLPK
ncbi:MAG: hypothetical protein WC828_07655 [Thermoleophilia bacterium]|jgi:tetratricopeptide (TPR) repeat protein